MGFGRAMKSEGTSIPAAWCNIDFVLVTLLLIVLFNSWTWKDYENGTLHHSWPMSAHASQAFITYTSARDCTDSEHLPWTFSPQLMS